MTSDVRALLKTARQAAENAYAPYSKTAQGAALETIDGNIYRGASVELASWAGSICAELAALAAAVADGQRQFKLLALAPFRFPCGVCRQAYREFGLDLEVVTQDSAGNIETRKLADLLPSSFGAHDL